MKGRSGRHDARWARECGTGAPRAAMRYSRIRPARGRRVLERAPGGFAPWLWRSSSPRAAALLKKPPLVTPAFWSAALLRRFGMTPTTWREARCRFLSRTGQHHAATPAQCPPVGSARSAPALSPPRSQAPFGNALVPDCKEFAFAPATPWTVRTGIGAGERAVRCAARAPALPHQHRLSIIVMGMHLTQPPHFEAVLGAVRREARIGSPHVRGAQAVPQDGREGEGQGCRIIFD